MKLRTVTRLVSATAANETRQGRWALAAFTLVEVVVAALIASIAFTGIFIAISSGNVVIQNTRENLRASQIIESRIEGLRLIAWGSNTNQLFNSQCFPTNFTEEFYPLGVGNGSTNEGVRYYGTVSFQSPTNFNSSYSDEMRLVTVNLKWTNSHYGVFNAHSRTMSTYVAKYGMQNYVWSSVATNN